LTAVSNFVRGTTNEKSPAMTPGFFDSTFQIARSRRAEIFV